LIHPSLVQIQDAVTDWLEVNEVGKVSQEAIQSALSKYKGFVSFGC
jgi:hypothetical protein